MSVRCSRPSSLTDEPAEPTPPKRPDSVWSPAPHVVWKVVNKNNVQLVSGMTRKACRGCWTDHPVRSLIRYRGKQLCPACFAARAEQSRAEARAGLERMSLAARAIAYMQRKENAA